MIWVAPYAAAVAIAARLDGVVALTPSDAVDFAALAVIVAGVFVVARYREALAASDRTADAWRDERDAEKAKADRLEHQLAEMRATNAVLAARPDLTELHAEMKDLAVAMRELKDVVRDGLAAQQEG